jgi:hypothetical protein
LKIGARVQLSGKACRFNIYQALGSRGKKKTLKSDFRDPPTSTTHFTKMPRSKTRHAKVIYFGQGPPEYVSTSVIS